MTDEKEIKKPERADFLKEARELTERQEKAVEEMRSLVERNEELAARNLLGGRSDVGVKPVKQDAETGLDYIKKFKDGLLRG